jgi:exodeoxyribonuclease VII large subunit
VIQPELAARPWTVTELNGQIHDLLQQRFRGILVKGEISGTKQVRGHVYFTLKDAGACIDAVIWQSTVRLLPMLPQDGQEMVATGTIDYYIARGQVKLIVSKLDYDGIGKLRQAVEALKAKLEAEGAFAAARKRTLPFLPRKVALITSPTGAVIHDLQQTIWERFPNSHLLLYPAAVQGITSAASVVSALAQCNRDRLADVCIIARGGGGFEELMAFNLEPVVRAILRSRIPVVTALGHTSDRTLSDLVADREARTPTAAAELVVPRRADLERALSERVSRGRRAGAHYLTGRRHDLALRRARHPLFADPLRYLLTPGQARILETNRRLAAAWVVLLRAHEQRLGHLRERLRNASPVNVLRARRRELSHRARRLSLGRGTVLARLAREQAAIDQAYRAVRRLLEGRVRGAAREVEARGQRLAVLSPQGTLERGYSICYDAATERIVRDAGATRTGAAIRVRLARGQLEATVDATREADRG